MPSLPSSPLPLSPLHADVLATLKWVHSASLTLPGRPAAVAEAADLPSVSDAARTLIDSGGPLYRHQAVGLARYLAGENVVLATGTGSGKTRVFHLAAAEQLARDPRSLTLALYPGKALAREQAARWSVALATAGHDRPSDVALITGDQSDKAARVAALRSAVVAVLTPDTLHAWFLAGLSQPSVRSALARVRLVIVDEAHTLSGVFGSNALWLLRRLQALANHLHSPPLRWLAASGTIAEPARHLEALTGQRFVVIGEKDDSSPRYERRLHFVRPADGTPLHTGLCQWLRSAANAKGGQPPRFVVFTQSRLQTESFALTANRGDRDDTDLDPSAFDYRRIAPYRAGLSPTERAELQDRFARGQLRGLICTAAFELGIDLPGLSLGFLVGLPESPASFWQRVGRLGRHGPAEIFLVDDGSPRTAAAFSDPSALLDWRSRDAALYPDNPILIARHVLCHDHERRALGLPEDERLEPARLPSPSSSFAEAHAALLRGEYPPALRDAVQQQGGADSPHLAFPLRAVEDTYTFRPAPGTQAAPEGFVTHSQVLREAYPGAVYYHGGTPWRIVGMNARNRILTVVRERHYRTRPVAIPPTFLPDLSQPALTDLRWPARTLRVIECRGRATESITGFTELRGTQSAPGGDYRTGAYGRSDPLYRTYESTGVILAAAAFDSDAVRRDVVASALREALLRECPREAAEVAAASGRLRADRRDLRKDDRFIALYDTVPGSLRLTAALAEPAMLRRVVEGAASIVRRELGNSSDPRDRATVGALDAVVAAIGTVPLRPPLEWPEHAAAQLAFAPGTPALHRRSNLVVTVEAASLDLDGNVVYRIRRSDDPAFHGQVPASAVVEIPDRSTLVPLADALLCAEAAAVGA